MEMTPETLEQRILKYRALAEVEDVSEPLLAIIDQLLAERELLPFDVHFPNQVFRKGVRLQTLIDAAARWKQYALDFYALEADHRALQAEREKDKAEITDLKASVAEEEAMVAHGDNLLVEANIQLAAKDKLLSESEDNYLKASMKLTEMIANAANALDDDGADHYGQAVRQQAADIKALREALERIEGISNEDYKTGGFLTGEIPENWMELALIDAKEMATETLAATDPNREVEG